MDDISSRFQTFVIRCWLEKPDSGGGGEWRGEVRHLPSGEAMRFADVNEGLEFIRSALKSDPRTAGEK